MKLITVQEAYHRKFQRQAGTPALELDAGGLCAHVGKISPGCSWCFSASEFSLGVRCGADVGLPNVCNLDCAYCYRHGAHEVRQSAEDFVPPDWKMPEAFQENLLARLLPARASLEAYDVPGCAFTGDGAEPLLFLPVIREYMKFLRGRLQSESGVRLWCKLYTNGLLATADVLRELGDLGLDEIRFHPGATGFSPHVFHPLRSAAGHIPTLTIETPAWPPHREPLLRMLPFFEDLGVKHLDLIEVAVTRWNYDSIAGLLPGAEYYHTSFGLGLDDGGLVYDVMNQAARRGCVFSVLDCNSLVRKVRDDSIFFTYFGALLRRQRYGSDLDLA